MRFNHGTTHFSDHFGPLHSVTPINLPGEGHVPHIELRFMYGARLDLIPETFAQILRAGPAALAKLPLIPDVHEAVGVDE